MALYAIDGTWSERKHRSNVYEFARRYKCPFVGTPANTLARVPPR
jgi:hypothetical protein